MEVKSERIEARVSPDQRHRIEQAALFSGESTSAFMVNAAVERADEVIATQTSTVVPADYFEALLAALDDPPQPSPRLTTAAKRTRRQRRIIQG